MNCKDRLRARNGVLASAIFRKSSKTSATDSTDAAVSMSNQWHLWCVNRKLPTLNG